MRLGIGVDRMEEELRKLFPGTPLFHLSAESVKTDRELHSLVSGWEESHGGILIGTEFAIPYLRSREPFVSVIASLDTLIALPDFRMGEKVFRLGSDIRRRTIHTTFLQTRVADFPTLQFLPNGDGLAFYRSEEESRKEFLYPPYSVFIKVTRRGKDDVVREDLSRLRERLTEYHTTLYPALVARVRDIFSAHLLIRVPRGKWPDQKLIGLLRALPPSFAVDVDPESVL